MARAYPRSAAPHGEQTKREEKMKRKLMVALALFYDVAETDGGVFVRPYEGS